MNSVSTQSDDSNVRKVHQMFNIAERHVMMFISSFLEEPHDTLFRDDLPHDSDPLILLPFVDYKSDTCIKFTIKMITGNDERDLSHINEIVRHQLVKNGIGFLWHCVKEVFASVVSSSLIIKTPLENIYIELNEQNWTFYPKYLSELSYKKIILESIILKLENMDYSPNNIIDRNNAVFELNKINEQITPELLDEEQSINKLYYAKQKLGIFIDDMSVHDLPKLPGGPELSTDNTEQTINNVDKKNNVDNLTTNLETLFNN